MSSRTWIYVVILIVVLGAGAAFFWWMYKSSKITPKAAEPVTPTFTDVPADYWAFKEIEAVNTAGIMVGYGKMAFKPEDAATRAVVAAVVSRAYSKTANPTAPSFTDVPATYWAYQNIEGLKAATYMLGETATTFNPEGVASRQVVCAVVARAHAGGDANVPAGPSTSPFSDVLTTDPLYKYIAYCNTNSIMTGTTATTFAPNDNASRAVVATAVSRAKLGGQSAVDAWTLPATAPSFIDVAATYPVYKNIEYVNAQGYMVGYAPVGGKTFEPTQGATRAMAAAAFSRATNKTANPATASFTDVPPEYWAYQNIEGMKTAGYMVGNGTVFNPDAVITRREVAIVLARAKGLTLADVATSSFSDVPANDPAIKEIEAIYKAGYTQGCGTNPLRFCPDDQTNRDVLAVFMYNGFLKTGTTSPVVQSPVASPATPTPTPTATVTITPTPTPVVTTTTVTTTTTTGAAKTGPEVPLLGTGFVGILFLARYLIGRKTK